MRYGLTTDTLKQIIDTFAKTPQVEEVILYGSRAMGNYQPGSDIDLALKGKNLDMAEMLKISIALDELDLPYHIDLLLFEKIKNQELIDHICRVGKILYP